ncbi:MAG: O-antigen ligase family protein [Candidatus Kaiserbacteria bacterium]|nr:O-antigen ligase family protein [Candidatus Kaiserbacteria bacterium]
MQTNNGTKQIARWVALGALFLITLTPTLIANSYFFPFITGKAFFFRILVEIAVCAWGMLAFLDKEYRPRFSWIGATVVAFVVWMFIADLFAPNVMKALWSNFERMEGWMLLIHLLGFFAVASAVLRVEKKWRVWFFTSLGVSLVVSGYALLQLGGALAIHQGSTRIDATLGNSAYLAIYFLFNVFIALWLAFSEKRQWLKWSLVALAVVESILIFFTETRGTIVGFIGAIALAAGLAACTSGKKVRGIAFTSLAILFVLIGSFYAARNSSVVQGNHILQRIASISLSDGQTRFTIWHMAFQGTLERPLTGWGQEGFNYVFNKYYDPSLYQQEPWFDRAHNAFIDWLTAGGIPAFLFYLSLFGIAIVMVWKNSELSRPGRILFTAALVGYACHNLFVFDNLYSYIYFFAILAFIDSQIARPFEPLERANEISSSDGNSYALLVAAAAFVLVWFVNIPGMQAANGLITALSSSSGDLSANITAFQNLTAHPAFAAQEIREQTVSFASSVVQSKSTTNVEKQQAVSLAITEMQEQVAAYPLDARGHLELSYAYRAAGDAENTLKEIKAAIALSPKKEEFWIEAGALEWDLGDVKAAQTDFNTAYALGAKFQDLALYSAAGDIVAGDQSAADKLLTDTFGTINVDNSILIVAYYRAKNWPRLISILKSRTEKPEASVENWFALAAAYYESGDNSRAINTIHTAVALYPGTASSGAAAIKQIQQGK